MNRFAWQQSKIQWILTWALPAILASPVAPSPAGQEGSSLSAEDWSDESAEALASFVQLKRYESSLRVRKEDDGKEGYVPRDLAWRTLTERWKKLVKDFPGSKLRVHAYWRLGNLYSGSLEAKADPGLASSYLRKAFELDPSLLSVETIVGRSQYAGGVPSISERAKRYVQFYRWLKSEAPALLEQQPPRINEAGYYLPSEQTISGKREDSRQTEHRSEASLKLLRSLLARKVKSTERHLTSLSKYSQLDTGLTILTELGDLLPEDVQAEILEVAGMRGPYPAQQPGEVLEIEPGATVVSHDLAGGLGNADVYVPDPSERVPVRQAIRAMMDTRQWLRRVLQDRWLPRRDRPKAYLPVTSLRGYDSVYRWWRREDTAFLAQSTYGWLELSVTPDVKGTGDKQAGRKRPDGQSSEHGKHPGVRGVNRDQIEARLLEVARHYLNDSQGILGHARFEVRPAPYGFEARLRVDAKKRRELIQADAKRQFEWLVDLKAYTDGTSYLIRLAPKTDADGNVRDDRKRWFGVGAPHRDHK